MSAEGLPIVTAEQVHPARHTFMFEGAWTTYCGRRGVYGVVQSSSGLTLMVDKKAVEQLAMALGIQLARPTEPEKLQTRCGWCRNLINEGPLDAHGRESTGICEVCRPNVRAGR